jgi:hypothetical protein
MVKEKEVTFAAATAAYQAVDKACSSATNTAITAASTLKAVTTSQNSRNPIIQKELDAIRMLIEKVGELKSINLQEKSGQEAARDAALVQSRDMIANLQSFDDEAAPLSAMIEMAREHAEFTAPIVKLLKQLEAKLLSEQNSLNSEVTSAKDASAKAASSASTTCEQKEARKFEEYVFVVN